MHQGCLFSLHIRNEKLVEVETAISRTPTRSINSKELGPKVRSSK